MSLNSRTPSLQTRIGRLERLTGEIDRRYRSISRQFLGIVCCEILLFIIVVLTIYPSLTPEMSENARGEMFLSLMGFQVLLYIMWQLMYIPRRDQFLKSYYEASAVCAELTDHADWTSFYLRDPGSPTRNRLHRAVRTFNDLWMHSLFPRITFLNQYTLLHILLNLLIIINTLLLILQTTNPRIQEILFILNRPL